MVEVAWRLAEVPGSYAIHSYISLIGSSVLHLNISFRILPTGWSNFTGFQLGLVYQTTFTALRTRVRNILLRLLRLFLSLLSFLLFFTFLCFNLLGE